MRPAPPARSVRLTFPSARLAATARRRAAPARPDVPAAIPATRRRRRASVAGQPAGRAKRARPAAMSARASMRRRVPPEGRVPPVPSRLLHRMRDRFDGRLRGLRLQRVYYSVSATSAQHTHLAGECSLLGRQNPVCPMKRTWFPLVLACSRRRADAGAQEPPVSPEQAIEPPVAGHARSLPPAKGEPERMRRRKPLPPSFQSRVGRSIRVCSRRLCKRSAPTLGRRAQALASAPRKNPRVPD